MGSPPKDDPPTVDRHRRKRAVRAATIDLRRATMPGRFHLVVLDEPRPATRGDCARVERPCPWVSCAHNLYLDVTRTGNIKLNFPDLEPGEMSESCSLDVADRGGETLERTGDLLNMTRERARQIVSSAMDRAERKHPLARELVAEGHRVGRRAVMHDEPTEGPDGEAAE